MLGEFFVPTGAVPRTCGRCGALQVGGDGGFALHEAFWRRVAGVSYPLVVQFPPSRGLPDGRGAQNADHLVQNTPNSPIFTEVVCVLGSSRGYGLLAHIVGRLARVVATRQPHCAFAR